MAETFGPGWGDLDRRFSPYPDLSGANLDTIRALNAPIPKNYLINQELPVPEQMGPPSPVPVGPYVNTGYFRGKGQFGEPMYTNISEVARTQGLQRFDIDTMLPEQQVGGLTMYGGRPLSATPPEVTGPPVPMTPAQTRESFALTPAVIPPTTPSTIGQDAYSLWQKGVDTQDKIKAEAARRGITDPKALQEAYNYYGVTHIDSTKPPKRAEQLVPFKYVGPDGKEITVNIPAIKAIEMAEKTETRKEKKREFEIKSQRALVPIDDKRVDSIAKGIVDGLIDPDNISKRAQLQERVLSKVREIDPNFDFIKAGAVAKFKKSTGTMNTEALLNTIDPLMEELSEAGKILGNTDVPGYNRVVNFLKEQTGSADIVGFNNLRDDVVAEIERGLMGTGVLSDSKYQRAMANINSAQSPSQLEAAIDNTKIVIKARLEALAKGPGQRQSAMPTSGKKISDMTIEELKALRTQLAGGQ